MNKPELIAPAGSLKKLKYAFVFGADAVYLGLPDFSLRARVNEFNLTSIKSGIDYAHKLGKKVYLTANIYAHNCHLQKFTIFIKKLKSLQPDALVVSDLGILQIIKKNYPSAKIHLSTQANTTNWPAAKFWQDQGVSRIILARELTLREIAVIHQKVPKLELETFVHGAMCMAYSGRCILSKWLTNRSANLGDCAHVCRWKYRMSNDQCLPAMPAAKRWQAGLPASLPARTAFEVGGREALQAGPMTNKIPMTNVQNSKLAFLEELKRPGEMIPVEEDEHGTYIFNSKDLCLIDYLPELQKAGVKHFKIEGRAKSVNYLSTVVKAYREAIDKCRVSKLDIRHWQLEFSKLANRGYHAGFIFGKNGFEQLWDQQHIIADHIFVGEVIKNTKNKTQNVKLYNNYQALVLVHNMLNVGDKVEAVVPFAPNEHFIVKKMVDVKTGREIKAARGGRGQKVIINLKEKLPKYTVLRKKC